MKLLAICWITAGLVKASHGVFSLHDDLLAFPQFEVIFSDNYILDTEAQLRISRNSLSSSPDQKPVSEDARNEAPSDLSPNPPSSDFPPSDSTTAGPSSYHQMILHNRPYLCAIPTVSDSSNTTQPPTDPDAEAAELARATDRGWELLKGMEGQCMYYISGWWSYSYCYNNAVKQFHALPAGKGGAPIFPPTEDPATPSYVLGKSDPPQHQRLDAGPTTPGLRTAGSTRYLSQTLASGTTCDLTNRPRRIEVQFHCHPQSADRIGWIKEVATCAYLMAIYTPRLCNDVAFLPPRENKAHGILCKEVVSSEPGKVEEYEARKRDERARKSVSATPAGRPVVAGIEVGAMKHVGKDGQKLEAPQQIVAHQPQGKVDLLARQESKEKGGKIYRLPSQAIKELGIDPKLADEAIKELRGVSGGKAWRLEVFDSPTGSRELRGIVEPEGGEQGGGGEVEFFVIGDEQEDDSYEDQEEDGDHSDGTENSRRDRGEKRFEEEESEEGSEEVYKDEL